MSDNPKNPVPSPPLHIAGAGTMVLGILLVSLSMLFIASMLAYLLIRSKNIAEMGDHPQWPPPGLPQLPSSLWISTIVIMISSVTIQLAHNAVRREDLGVHPPLLENTPTVLDRRTFYYLLATLILGIVFLLLQAFNWYEFYKAIDPAYRVQGPWLGMFYTLTGLHAAHVIGGLIPLGIVTYRARLARYSRNYHPGIRYTTIYWHFLDVIWLALFFTLKL